MALKSYGDRLLRAFEVADYLNFELKTLYNLRVRGEGPPAYKIGGPSGPIRYRKSDVDAWLAERKEVGK